MTRLGARPLKLGPSLNYGEFAAVLEREQPDTFVGMPGQLLSALRACGRGSLRRALVSGDACPDSVISGCERILGSRLFPHYGSREMGMAGAVTCPAHEGMHLRENHVIPEIVDETGQVLPRGEWGELVITTVGMEALPLIRYRTGDVTRILPEPCPCGSATIRLDRLRRRAGNRIEELDEALFSLPELVDYTARLEDGELRIRGLTAGPYPTEKIQNRAEGIFPGVGIRVELSPAGPEDRPLNPGKRILGGMEQFS